MVGHPTASGFFPRRRQFPAAGRDPGDGHRALYPYQARHNYATTNVRDLARQIRGKWRGSERGGGRIHLIVTFNGLLQVRDRRKDAKSQVTHDEQKAK